MPWINAYNLEFDGKPPQSNLSIQEANVNMKPDGSFNISTLDDNLITKPDKSLSSINCTHPEGNITRNIDSGSIGVMLPDYLKEGLDIVVIGINPSLGSGNICHHYAGTGNHFWTCLHQSRLIPVPIEFKDDASVLNYGIGFTNICARTSKGTSDLTRKDVKEGSTAMLEKIRFYKPKIVVFNGKGIYETYIGHKNFSMGKQQEPLEDTNTAVFVMPSSSARCAQLPRAEDKLPFFVALRKLKEYMRGERLHLDESEVVFADYTEFRVTQPDPKSLRKAERRRKRKAEAAAAAGAPNALQQGGRNPDGCSATPASPRKRKKTSAGVAFHHTVDILTAPPPTPSNLALQGPFALSDHFQRLQQTQLQASAQPNFLASQPQQQLFTMQHAAASAQFHSHPQQQMFVSPGGQLMTTATPIVSIAMPTGGPQQAAAAAVSTAGYYGSPFQQFIVGQSAATQPGMVAWPAAAAAAAAAYQQVASAGQHTAVPSQPAAQQFVFTGAQPTGAAYTQPVYLAPTAGSAGTPHPSYHLLPVGCHPQAAGFTGVFVSDQHHLTQQQVTPAPAGTHYALPIADTSSGAAAHQQQFITLGGPQFKVMAVGPGGQLIPTTATADATSATTLSQFLTPGAAAASAPSSFFVPPGGKINGVRVTAVTPQVAKHVTLVQTAAGSDEGSVQTSSAANGTTTMASPSVTAAGEKVVYSAL